MRPRSSAPPARPWLGAGIALSVVSLVLLAEVGGDTPLESETGVLLAVVLVGLIAGLLVAKRPDHPISWLLAFAAGTGALAGVSAQLLPPGLTEASWWQVVLALFSGPSWFGLLATILILMPLLFPTGSPPSPRWRWVLWLSILAWAAISVLWMFQERFCTEWGDDGCIVSVPNPIGVDGLANPEETATGKVLFGMLLLCSLSALVSLIVRYRRSVVAERQQIKWVLLSVGLFVLFTLSVDVLWVDTLGGPQPPGYRIVQQTLWVMIPASVALAILRYRLYDLDRIISRSVAYALVVGLLGLVALALVSLLAMFMPSDDPLVVAVTTLSAAALFNPLRHRVQKLVDRKFNRTRFDTVRVTEHFAETLRDRIDPDEVVTDLFGVVSETMQPSTLGVWTRT